MFLRDEHENIKYDIFLQNYNNKTITCSRKIYKIQIIYLQLWWLNISGLKDRVKAFCGFCYQVPAVSVLLLYDNFHPNVLGMTSASITSLPNK